MRGLAVVEVSPDGPAAGLIEPGEIIDSIDSRHMRYIADLDEVLASAPPNKALRVRLLPGDKSPARTRTVLLMPRLPSSVR